MRLKFFNRFWNHSDWLPATISGVSAHSDYGLGVKSVFSKYPLDLNKRTADAPRMLEV